MFTSIQKDAEYIFKILRFQFQIDVQVPCINIHFSGT